MNAALAESRHSLTPVLAQPGTAIDAPRAPRSGGVVGLGAPLPRSAGAMPAASPATRPGTPPGT